MTSTEMIEDMLERQKKYDAEVFKKHNVDYVSNTFTNQRKKQREQLCNSLKKKQQKELKN